MRYLLDTDTCISVLRQQPGFVQRLSQLAPSDCAVSMITVFELFCGVAKARDSARERQKVERFVSAVGALPFDHASAEAASQIRTELERRGKPIGPFDLLIAGQALANGLTLVTSNVQEFQRVEGLQIETWP